MSRQFQVWHDFRGDLWARGGWVINAIDGTSVRVMGARASAGEPSLAGRRQGDFVTASSPEGSASVGGSGNNVALTTAVSNTLVPVGLFKPAGGDVWAGDQFTGATVTLNGDGSAEIDDGTDIVASVPAASCTIAPYGTFAATSYGKTTYNSGTDFDIEVTYEGGGAICSSVVSISSGTAQAGVFSGTALDEWTSDDDSDWKIRDDGSGGLEIFDGTDVVSTRTGGSLVNPSGIYTATSYGKTTYNSGGDFRTEVTATPAVPLAGWVYLVVTESSAGIAGSVAGPFFAASLPASSDPDYTVPLAFFGAPDGLQQIQEGSILWR